MPKYFSMEMCRSSLFNFDVILKRVCVGFYFEAVTINDMTLVSMGALHLCASIYIHHVTVSNGDSVWIFFSRRTKYTNTNANAYTGT